jgi:hydrogenase large subunit
MSNPAVSRLILGPFNRVEGDLEVQLEVQDGVVREARVNAPLYRGFENMLIGREPMDALTIVPRICGICSVSQSVAAAKALADAAGVTPPPNGQLAINLMLACENLADHLTHFYVFFMPDFTRPVYAKRNWFAQASKRFAAVSGTSGAGEGSRALLAARARWFALMGTLGGKWPHTGSVLPGGSSRALEPNEVLRMRAKVREMRQFLESTLFGTSLESFIELGTLAALQSWQTQAAGSDLALFLDIAQDAQLNTLGTGSTRFLSYGAYANANGKANDSAGGHGFAQGVWTTDTASLSQLKASEITEDPRHAWLADEQGALHPAHGITQPLLDKPGAYTWNKAPRLNGAVMETGAIARQLVDGQALVRAAVAVHGASVGTRVLARLMEVARIVPLMEQWLSQFQARESFHTPYQRPAHGQGVGLSEAARGALGHWLRIEHGKLSSYQIVAPTSWNFSPRDSAGVPGALEAALVGTAIGQEGELASESVAVQHIVRSFDPCMVCTVH